MEPLVAPVVLNIMSAKLVEKTMSPMHCLSRRASLLAVGLLNLTVCCVGLASCISWFILKDNLRTVGDGFDSGCWESCCTSEKAIIK